MFRPVVVPYFMVLCFQAHPLRGSSKLVTRCVKSNTDTAEAAAMFLQPRSPLAPKHTAASHSLQNPASAAPVRGLLPATVQVKANQ